MKSTRRATRATACALCDTVFQGNMKQVDKLAALHYKVKHAGRGHSPSAETLTAAITTARRANIAALRPLAIVKENREYLSDPTSVVMNQISA